VVARLATGAHPSRSIVGTGTFPSELLTVKVCAPEPAPPNTSEAGEIVTVGEPGGGGGGLKLEPPPPPQALSETASTRAAKAERDR
jgi:hypothetical protein